MSPTQFTSSECDSFLWIWIRRGGKYSPKKGCMTDCYLLIAIDDLLCEFAVAGNEFHDIKHNEGGPGM